MAEPQLPPWLQQQADPLGSTYRGVQIGGALAGVLNQRNLTQSRLRLDQQEEQIKHMAIEKAAKQRDEVLEADFIMQAAKEKIAPLLEAGKFTEARNVLLALAARKTIVVKSDLFPELLKSVEGAVQTETTRLQLQSMDKLRVQQEKESASRTRKLNLEGDEIVFGEDKALGFTEMNLPSGHIILQNKATGAGIVIDPTKKAVQAHLSAFKAEDAALQKQITDLGRDIMMQVSPEKKAAALAEIEKKRASNMQTHLSRMMQDQFGTQVEGEPAAVAPAPVTPPSETLATPESVRQAFKNGEISREMAERILKEKFKFK